MDSWYMYIQLTKKTPIKPLFRPETVEANFNRLREISFYLGIN